MHLKNIGILFCFFLISISVSAQKISPKELLERAENFYANEKYFKALPYYLKYRKYKPKDNDLKLKIGICYIETNRPEQAIGFLEDLAQQKEPNPKAILNMARSHHDQHQFSSAVKFYKKYLSMVDEDDQEERFRIKDEIKRCGYGQQIMYKDKLALVENLGDKVNTSDDDFAPVFNSRAGNTLYFSTTRSGNVGGLQDEFGQIDTLKGEYRADIFKTSLIRGQWSVTRPADEYNTHEHEVVYDVTDDGAKICFGRTKYKNFDYARIFMNNLSGVVAENDYEFPGIINSGEWDGNAQLFDDNVIIFSSDRPGGFGGKDLYIATKEDGVWSRIRNMGPYINSPYDEDNPFISADGRTLFFSSNSLKSIGGYDIFRTQYLEDKEWSEAENVGFPINSAGDDDFFRLSEDGLRAYFSSSRANGYGKRDIYVAYFKRPRPESTPAEDIAFRDFLEGETSTVSTDPSIQVPSAEPSPNTVIIPGKTSPSNPEAPSYTFTPLFYQDYNNLLVTGPSVKEMDKMVKLLTRYPELKLEITGHTDAKGPTSIRLLNSIKNAESIAEYFINKDISANRIKVKGVGSNYPIAKEENADGTDNKTGRTFNRRIEMRVYGYQDIPINFNLELPDMSSAMQDNTGEFYLNQLEGLTYKVQIKALKQMLEDPVLDKYSDPLIESIPQVEFKRYSMGLFGSFAEANSLKRKLIVDGFSDAFIVAYIDGERIEKRNADKYIDIYPDLARFITGN